MRPATLRRATSSRSGGFHLGNMDALEKLYLESLAHEPRQPQGLAQLGRLRMAEGNLAAARARLEEALQVDPAFVQAMIFIAQIDLKEGEAGSGDRLVRQGDRRRNEQSGALPAVRGLLFPSERLRESDGLVERRRSTHDPTRWRPIYNLACVQMGKGDANAAFAYLQQAVAAGFTDQKLLRADPCFQALHTDPRFVAIAGRSRRNRYPRLAAAS